MDSISRAGEMRKKRRKTKTTAALNPNQYFEQIPIYCSQCRFHVSTAQRRLQTTQITSSKCVQEPQIKQSLQPHPSLSKNGSRTSSQKCVCNDFSNKTEDTDACTGHWRWMEDRAAQDQMCVSVLSVCLCECVLQKKEWQETNGFLFISESGGWTELKKCKNGHGEVIFYSWHLAVH